MKISKFNRVLGYVKPYWGSVTMNIVFTILATIFSLFSFSMIVPFLNLLFNPDSLITVKPEFSLSSDVLLETMNYYISTIIISKGQKMALLFICIMLVFAFFLRNLTTYMASYYMAAVRVNSIKDLRAAVYNKILVLPLSFYSRQKKGDIIARITTDLQEIEVSIMNYLDVFIKSPITIIAYFAYMLGVSWELTLFVLCVLPIGGVVIGKIGKSLKKDSKE